VGTHRSVRGRCRYGVGLGSNVDGDGHLWYPASMVPSQAQISSFDCEVRQLFASRPYWLVQEALVRSAFVDCLLSGHRDQLPGWDASKVCFEAKHGTKKKLDLVARLDSDRCLAVEFKGWNIVTKFDPDAKRLGASNAAVRHVNAQFSAIRNDAEKLACVARSASNTTCLLIIYSQNSLGADHASRFAGRKHAKPLPFTISDYVADRQNFLKAAREDMQDELQFDLNDMSPNKSSFSCACGTQFILRIFQVIPVQA
jgi:hypothetical protein